MIEKLTPTDAAAFLGITTRTLRKLPIETVRLTPGRAYYTREALQRYVDSVTQKPKEVA